MISLEKMFTFLKGDIAKSNSLISNSQIDSLIKAAQNSFVNAEGIITNNISKLSATEKAKKVQNIIDAGQNEKISDNKKRLDRMEEK